MESAAGKPKVYWRIEDWFPEIPKEKVEKLFAFYYELLRFNKRINLISPRTAGVADEIHFADSILGAQMVMGDFEHPEIYDIGAGNGFPGIVMAILYPSTKFVFVDTDVRKIEFLKVMGTRLGLDNTRTINKPVEELPEGLIQCAVSRAFASISKSLVLTRHSLALNSSYYHFKGDGWFREVGEIPIQICSFFAPSHLGEYSLPVTTTKHSIVKVIKKK